MKGVFAGLCVLASLSGPLAPGVSAFSQTAIASRTSDPVSRITSGYDNVGNRLSRTSSLPGVINQSFGYDSNDRLNGDQYDRLNGDQYDNNGNTKTAATSQLLTPWHAGASRRRLNKSSAPMTTTVRTAWSSAPG